MTDGAVCGEECSAADMAGALESFADSLDSGLSADNLEICNLAEELSNVICEWFESSGSSWPVWKVLMVLGVASGGVAMTMYDLAEPGLVATMEGKVVDDKPE